MLSSKAIKVGYYLFSQRKLLSKYERWRRIARSLKLSKTACLRLEWLIYYETTAHQNISLTCRHFGLAKKTFYKWQSRFNELNLRSLEDQSKAPLNTRQKEYTQKQYERFLVLRRQYIRYGKFKLLEIYHREYPEDMAISGWKIQGMIQRSGLYYKPIKQAIKSIEKDKEQ